MQSKDSESQESPGSTVEETDELPLDAEAELSDHGDDDTGEDQPRRSRLRRLARKLMDRRELSADTKDLLGSVMATSDSVRTEAVRLAAREVRSYLDAMELKEAMHELVTGYSLEVSVSLKPLAKVLAGNAELDDEDASDEEAPEAPDAED
jgi:hypothetical protein